MNSSSKIPTPDAEDQLTPKTRPTPPEGLLEDLVAQIPNALGSEAGSDPSSDDIATFPRRRTWLSAPTMRIAAAVVVLIGAGLLTLRLRDTVPEPGEKRVFTRSMESVQPPAFVRPETSSPDGDSSTGEDEVAPALPQEMRARREAIMQRLERTRPEETAAPADRRADTATPADLASTEGVFVESIDPGLDATAASPVVAEEVTVVSEAVELSPAPESSASAPLVGRQNVELPKPTPSTGSSSTGSSSTAQREANRRLPPPAAQPEPQPPPPTTRTANQEYESDHNEQVARLESEQRRLQRELKALEPVSSDAVEEITVTSEAPLVDQYRLRALGYVNDATPSPADRDRERFFADAGISTFVSTQADPVSTFALDVDTGSFSVAQRYLNQHTLPPPASIRVEEWLNSFDYDDPTPRSQDFAISAQLAEGGLTPSFGEPLARHLLRVGVKARELGEEQRPPSTLVFLVDVSGSMRRPDRLALVKRALGVLVDELDRDDRVGLVVYGSNARVVLEPTHSRYDLVRAIESLRSEGSTNLQHGLELAYEQAWRHFRSGVNHRVILCSDGVANVGLTQPAALLRNIEDWASRGIDLTTVGFGMGDYNDHLMEQLADRGDGSYHYVSRLDDARKVFQENLTGTLYTVAADARIQVEFDPRWVENYRLVGYENRDVPDAAFRDPGLDAGEIGSGHAVTALYELSLVKDRRLRSSNQTLAEVRLRYRSKSSGDMKEQQVRVRAGRPTQLTSAPPSLKLASVVAEFAEGLKTGEADLNALHLRAQRLLRHFQGRTDVLELVQMIGRAKTLLQR